MHFIPSLLTEGNATKFLFFGFSLSYPPDRQGSRCNATLLILPGAKDLTCFLFHLFMNTVITAGHS